ncbi:hypothetical protein [Hyphococcus sp.]|uniref:hypothetical protein n=1 Tax=Hyphococcus sp. TaxID=2038636 RepID=UPI0040476ECB
MRDPLFFYQPIRTPARAPTSPFFAPTPTPALKLAFLEIRAAAEKATALDARY